MHLPPTRVATAAVALMLLTGAAQAAAAAPPLSREDSSASGQHAIERIDRLLPVFPFQMDVADEGGRGQRLGKLGGGRLEMPQRLLVVLGEFQGEAAQGEFDVDKTGRGQRTQPFGLGERADRDPVLEQRLEPRARPTLRGRLERFQQRIPLFVRRQIADEGQVDVSAELRRAGTRRQRLAPG